MSKIISRGWYLAIFVFVLLPVGLRWNGICGHWHLNLGLVALDRAVSVAPQESASLELTNAKRWLAKADTYSQSTATAQWGLGLAALLEGETQKAVRLWRLMGVQVEHFLNLGASAEAAQAWEWATAWYEVAGVLDPAGAAEPLGILLTSLGDYERAASVLQSALDTFPQHPRRLSWWRGLAESFRASRQWDAAAESAEKGLLEFPDDAALLIGLGKALHYSGQDTTPVVEAVLETIDRSENEAENYAAMAELMSYRGEYAEAFYWYAEAMALDPDNKWWPVAQANMARAMGDLSLSITLYQAALSRQPEYAPAYYDIAWALHLAGRHPESVDAVKKALTLMDYPRPNYYVRAAQICESAGRSDEALSYYRQAFRLAPDDSRVLEGLKRLDKHP